MRVAENGQPLWKGWFVMGKPTINQLLALQHGLFGNIDWESTPVDSALIQEVIDNCPKGGGQEFLAFLRNHGRVNLRDLKFLKIDRSKPVDLKFFGDGWTIDEEDEYSLALTEIDLTSIHFDTTLKSDERWIVGEEKLKLLKDAGHIRLDAKVLQTLLENQYMIPDIWKRESGGVRFIHFDGTVLSKNGYRWVLFLCFRIGLWQWGSKLLQHRFDVQSPSAILTK